MDPVTIECNAALEGCELEPSAMAKHVACWRRWEADETKIYEIRLVVSLYVGPRMNAQLWREQDHYSSCLDDSYGQPLDGFRMAPVGVDSAIGRRAKAIYPVRS